MSQPINATDPSIAEDSALFISQMEAAETVQELTQAIREARIRLDLRYPAEAESSDKPL